MIDLSPAADLCRQFEGFRSAPYLCPAGIPTIGYGSTHYQDGTPVTLADAPVTREQADIMLMGELARCAASVRRLCPALEADARRFCAVVDFVYNLGAGRLQTSTLRRRLNAQDWDGAREQLMRWVRGGGRVLPGLVARRRAESAML